MTEVLGVIAGVSQLLEQSIEIIGRVRQAFKRDKELEAVLSDHDRTLDSTKVIIDLVVAQKALQTAAVKRFANQIAYVATKINACLVVMDPEDHGKVRRALHQLTSGSKELSQLGDAMLELDRAKADLGLCLQVSNVGLLKTPEDTLVADAKLVEKISARLEQVLGVGKGLKIAQLIKNRQVNSDGTVPLNDDDEEILVEEGRLSSENTSDLETISVDGKLLTSRIIIDNLTEDQASQINGPLGEDIWKDISNLEIRGNKALGESEQINYAISLEAHRQMKAQKRADLELKQAQKRSDLELNQRIFLQQAGIGLLFLIVVVLFIKFGWS